MRVIRPNLDRLRRSVRTRYGPRGGVFSALRRYLGVEEIDEQPSVAVEREPANEQRQVAVRVLRSRLYSHRR